MKTQEQALAEWVSDEIFFDCGYGLKKFTASQFEQTCKAIRDDDPSVVLNMRGLRASKLVVGAIMDTGIAHTIHVIAKKANRLDLLIPRYIVQFQNIEELRDAVQARILKDKYG